MGFSTRDHYESFLINNVSTISSLESTLRSITWFLPGRFKDAELASETLTASLNIMSMYHDTLLARMVKNNPNYQPLIPLSLHSRFTRAWIDRSFQYKWTSRILEIIKFTELVIEMGLRRRVSQQTKWRCIITLEIVKAAMRLFLLKLTRRPLVAPLIPERDFDPTSLPSPDEMPSPAREPNTHLPSPLPTPDHLKNNMIALSPHELLSPSARRSETAPEDYLLPKALTGSSVKPSLSLISKLSGPRDWASEIIYVLRPLVYVLLLVSDREKGHTSNRALVTALAMEFFSRNLRRTPPPSATLERTEYGKRDKDMLWYLLRGPIWEQWTRPKLQGFVQGMSTKPLLGLFGALVHDWIPLIDEYHYYTAP